ncbi:hypothetical protein Stok01_01103 [Sulfurisphaera tokodaii]
MQFLLVILFSPLILRDELNMDTKEKTNLINIVFQVIEENVPIDCEDLIADLRRKFMKDVRDLGLEGALQKWLNSDNDVEIITS